jgi:hypothetical protein
LQRMNTLLADPKLGAPSAAPRMSLLSSESSAPCHLMTLSASGSSLCATLTSTSHLHPFQEAAATLRAVQLPGGGAWSAWPRT